MKPYLSYQMCSIAAIALLLGGCGSGGDAKPELETSQPQPANSTPPLTPKPFQVTLFTTDELFAVGGGGCGMTLLPMAPEPTEPGTGNILLFHGIDSSPMLMKINGEMVEFELEDSSGEEFYGQKTRQTFSNAELGLTIDADVSLGEPGEIESVAISEGTVSITAKPVPVVSELEQRAQRPVASASIQAIAVTGDAGC